MSNKPITSRIKRSPLLKYSPLKNEDDPVTKKYGSEEGEEREVKTKEVSKRKKTWDDLRKEGMSEEDIAKAKKWREENPDVPNVGVEEVVEKTKTVKDPDLEYDTTIMKTKKEGTMLQPWEVRQQLRAKTRADRQVNKTRRKMEKYGTFDDEGNFTANPNLSARDKRKLQQAKSGYAAAQDMTKNISTGIKGGRAAGESYFQGQREKLKGESDPQEQLEQAKQEAKRNARAQAQGITTGTSQAAAAIDPGSQFSSMQINPADYALDFKPGDYSSLLKMKSSPAKKALKGNQYKLPQHLQKAIKAAPGKLKTPLKKGYFKNK